VHSAEEGALEGMSLRVLPDLRRTHEYENLPLRKQLSFDYLLFPWEHENI
jgi:hypothetical protein